MARRAQASTVLRIVRIKAGVDQLTAGQWVVVGHIGGPT
jgi:hypothetical protein